MNIFKKLFRHLLHRLSNNSGALYCDGVNGGCWKESILGSQFSAMTVSFIITPSNVDAKSSSTWDQIITFNGNYNAFYVRLDETGVPIASFFQGGSTWTRITGSGALSDNVPVVLTATYNRKARSSLYLNGVENVYITAPDVNIGNSTGWNFSIGGESLRTSDVIHQPTSYIGLIEEYYIWNTCLSADEVAILASKIRGIGRSIRTSNLYVYFPLNDYPDGTDTVGNYFYNHYIEVAGTQNLLATTGSQCRASVLVSSAGWAQYVREDLGIINVLPDALSLELSLLSDVGIVINATPTPSALSLSLSVLSPTVSGYAIVLPSTLGLTLSLLNPVWTIPVSPAALTLSLSLNSPTVDIVADSIQTPNALSLTLTQYAPVIDTEVNATVLPSALTLTLTQQMPSLVVNENATISPNALTLSLSLLSPVAIPVQAETSLILTLTLQTPAVASNTYVTVLPTYFNLALTLNDPVPAVLPGISALALSLSLEQPVFIIYPSAIALTLTLYDPVAAYDTTFSDISTLALLLTLYDNIYIDTGSFRRTKGPILVEDESVNRLTAYENSPKLINPHIY